MVFGAMLLFIYKLTRIFYEKLLSLCQNQGAKWQKQEVAISHNCKAQLIPLFYPQVCNCLIIRVVHFLHRKIIFLHWKPHTTRIDIAKYISKSVKHSSAGIYIEQSLLKRENGKRNDR